MIIKHPTLWLSCIAIAFTGCSKQSTLEGKITDARGQAISEFKVIAEQTTPINGYERFETKTGADGVFRFAKLHPSAEYTLIPSSDQWQTEERRIKVNSAPDGQTKSLPESISFRYKRSNDGIITDSKAGLEWYLGSAEVKSWEEIRGWTSGLTVGGGGWRMPAGEELKTIQRGDEKKPSYDPVFNINNCVWPVEQKTTRVWVADSGYYGPRYYGPWYHGGYYGPRGGYWETQGKGGKCRGVAVRAIKP